MKAIKFIIISSCWDMTLCLVVAMHRRLHDLTASINRVNLTAPSKAWVWGRSLAGIAGSNPASGMKVCLL